MGGSGGGFFSIKDKPQEHLRKIRDAKIQTKKQLVDIEVNGIIGKQLSGFGHDPEIVNQHLETIKNALGKDIEDTLNLLYGGSVAKHTYVDGLSDIDALVLLKKSELENMTPDQLKDYFFSQLKKRLPNTEIEKGSLAITVKFSNAEIQLLPALRTKTGFKIADSTGMQWSLIKPRKFVNLLTKVNQKNGGKVIPTIKLAKSIMSQLPENRRTKSYHTEALAIEIFRNYDGLQTPKTMLKHFFLHAPKLILNPIKDITGQSKYVDEYLGPSGSVNRRIVVDALGLIGRRMQNADGAGSVRQWCDILGEEKE